MHLTRRPHTAFDRDFETLFDSFLSPTPRRVAPGWTPALDIVETETEYRLFVELPGLGKDDVRIEFTDNVLSLKGEKKSVEPVEGERWHRVERRAGVFERRLELPVAVEADRIGARFRDGVLTVTIPKAEEARPREISIES
jgi:HSP20 family protein